MLNRRTRAASSKSTIMTIGRDGTKIEVVDQNFASPKRKDCKLDMDSVQTAIQTNGRITKSSPVHNVTSPNGKRNHRNIGGGGGVVKTKKSPQPITKYFPSNGHNLSNGSLNNSINETDLNVKTEKNDVENEKSETLPNGHHENNVNQNTANIENEVITMPIQNACMLMSPDVKAQLNGSMKQTTPHRIVIRSSPSKKQRLIVKDPVEVFSNLNIRDGSTKTNGRKGKKTRRKLNVNETELNTENGVKIEKEIKSEKNVDDDGDDGLTVVNGTESVPKINVDNKSNVKKCEKSTEKINDECFTVPNNATAPRRVHNTQMTDFFPIRRSCRKTKKVVEQELSNHIDMAIEKQLEDGLVVKVFPEKGRGIVAGRDFQRGEFVVEYIGELIGQTEADRREELYSQKVDFGCYMYYFKHKEHQWCIDATAETGKLGRLVNHSRNGNLMTKIVSYKNKPHLVLLAKDDIKEGEELLYDYGDRRKEALIHHPWLAL